MKENLSAPAQNTPPDVKRYSAEEFSKITGIKRGTLRSWACRGHFAPAENNGRGKQSYFLESQIADALALAKKGKHATNKPSEAVPLFDNEAVEAEPARTTDEKIGYVSDFETDAPLTNDDREDDGSNDDAEAEESIEDTPPADKGDLTESVLPPAQIDTREVNSAATIETAERFSNLQMSATLNSTQMIDNLPTEILSQKRFFKVGKNKVPLVSAWSNPANQCSAKDVDGLAGFDISGHELAVDYLLVDFDHVFDGNGNFVNDDAKHWYEFCVKAGSYDEISISGTGAHFIFKPTPDKFPPTANGKNGVLHFGGDAKLELFYKTKGRYCLLTGKVKQCVPKAPVVAGDAADKVFAALLKEIADRLQKSSAPARESNVKSILHKEPAQIDSLDYDLFRAQRMLDDINPANLNDTDWLAVMSACKNIGVPYSVVDSWNQRDPERYREVENQTRWDSLDDPNFHIGTLHGIAKRFYYSEKDSTREWFKLHPDFDKSNTDRVQSARKYFNTTDAEPIGISDSTSETAPRQERADSMKELMTTREVADLLGVSRKTVENWRQRKLFGCYFFSADEKHGDTLYYYRERVLQLKAVYQKGILQDMYKLARKNPETTPPADFQKPPSSGDTNNFGEELSFRHAGFFKADEVADIFGVDVRTIERWVKSGQLKEDMLGHNGDLYFGIDNVLNFTPPKEKNSADADKKIRDWEKVNGVINPQLLADMKAYAVKIDEIKKLDDVAKAASDTSVLKMLGLFRFYSPFAHVEKKFLANLTRKVEEAKAKVKAWNKHVKDTDKYNAACLCAKREVDTSKKPTDFEYSLAAIKPRIVNEKIDSSANAAKRDHKKWLVQHQCDELNAKRQAERQAYEEAPPTTKQEVPDCPVDLILPLGATFTDNGIKFVDWAKPPRDGRPRVVVSHNPIVPTKIFYNDADGTISYEVAIKLDNHWRTGIFPARIFNDARAVLALADYGLKISEPRLLTKFFADFFALNEKIVPNEDAPRLPRVKKFSNPGWHKIDDKKKFLDPRDLPAGVEIDAEQNGLISHLKSQGSLDKWKETYELAKTSVIARAMINGSVAPPLLDIIGERNFMLYLKGKTRGGKTTCLLLGASAVGTEKLVRSFDATKNGLAALAADYSDYALLIDEGQVADVKHADQLRQIPYMLTNGVGRTRSDRSGKVRSADSWRTIVLATGEVDLLDPKTTPEGVITRMMTIAAPKVILPPAVCSTIRENIKDNHGLAFPLIITKISELGAAKIKDSYKGTVEALAEEYPNHLNDYRRYVATLTLADALLNAALGADFDAALDDATGNFAFPFFELIPTEQELSLTQEYVDFVHSLIAQNQSRFVGGSGFDINKPIKIMGKLDADDGYTYIIAEAFHEECERCGLNPRKVVADLVEAEFFVPDDKIEAGHKTHRLNVPYRIMGRLVRCYRIRNETLDADE